MQGFSVGCLGRVHNGLDRARKLNKGNKTTFSRVGEVIWPLRCCEERGICQRFHGDKVVVTQDHMRGGRGTIMRFLVRMQKYKGEKIYVVINRRGRKK